MKLYLKMLLLLGVVSFGFYSCGDQEEPDFDEIGGVTLVQFADANLDAIVRGNGDETYRVPIEVTTVSGSDRVFNYSVNELTSTALPSQYSLGPNIVVPANSHVGFLEVTAIEANLSPSIVFVDVTLEEGNGFIVENETLRVNLFLECPLPDGFLTGMYELDTSVPCLNGACFGNSPVVVEVMDLGDNRRSFTANYLSQFNIGQPDMTFTFTLFCGRVLVGEEQGTNLACGGNSLTLGTPAMASTFDDTDDSFIEINFTDDSISSCGGATQSAIILTKI